MIRSMTGYGKRIIELPGKNITIEIRTLNSKQTDINTRMPSLYREKDMELRNILSQKLIRGKMDLSLQLEYKGEETNYSINSNAVRDYYQNLEQLNDLFDANQTSDYLSIIMRLPEVVKAEKEELNEDEWHKILDEIKQVIEDVNNFRIHEGKILGDDFRTRIEVIQTMLTEIEKYESGRIERIREKLFAQLSSLPDIQIDRNRLEQEMIFYLEKFDITEEKVRLKKHCDYFVQVMKEEMSQGKKLSFITQEIGREVNTIGSKANDADIQKIIVNMKDELEKIKEQLMNIL